MTLIGCINNGMARHHDICSTSAFPAFVKMPQQPGEVFYPDQTHPLIYIERAYGDSNAQIVFDLALRQFSLLMPMPTSQKHSPAGKLSNLAETYFTFDLPVKEKRGHLIRLFSHSLDTPWVVKQLSFSIRPHLLIQLAQKTAQLFLEWHEKRGYVRKKCRFAVMPERGELLLLPHSLTAFKTEKTASPLFALIYQLEGLFFHGKNLKKTSDPKDFLPQYRPIYDWVIKSLNPRSCQSRSIEEVIALFDRMYKEFLKPFLVLPLSDPTTSQVIEAAKKTLATYPAIAYHPADLGIVFTHEREMYFVKPLLESGGVKERLLIRGGLIGSGNMKQVFRGILLHGTAVHHVAISVFKDMSDVAKREDLIQKEVLIASQMAGKPHIVSLWETRTGYRSGKLCFEQIQALMSIDLKSASKHALLDLRHKITVFRDVAIGLQAFHEQGSLFGDLKPENILIRYPEMTACLGDIASGGQEGRRNLGFYSTSYSSPERLEAIHNKNTLVTSFHDAWSLGVSVLDTFYGMNLETQALVDWWNVRQKYETSFDRNHTLTMSGHIYRWIGDVLAVVSALPEGFPKSVIAKTLVVKADQRLSAKEIQAHFQREIS